MDMLEQLELLSEESESRRSAGHIRTVLGLLRLSAAHRIQHSTLLFIRAGRYLFFCP